MQERVARVQGFFYFGLLLMLATAILSAAAENLAAPGGLTWLILAGAATALVARIRLSQLQRNLRRHDTRMGGWAMR